MLRNITVTNINELYTVNSYTGRSVAIVNRKCYGISFCKSGKITYTHDGKKFVSTSTNAIILPQGATYTLYNNSGGEFPVINFTCTEDFCNEFSVIPLKHPTDYLRDYEQILKYFSSPNGKLKAYSLFYAMLYRLFSESRADNPILSKLLPFIESNLANSQLNNKQLSEFSSISESYLRKLFSQNLNTSPKQYVLSRRIIMSERLLSETDRTITDISTDCGFSNVYHFCRAFKEKTGTTPSQYRLQNRKFDI